jgi:hypothetical protein
MKEFLLGLSFILFTNALSGQELLGSSGGHNFSLGEAFIATQLGSGLIVSEGFHQPYISLIDIHENPDVSINVYPNPTSDKLTLEHNLESVIVFFYDSQGQVVFTDNRTSRLFDLSSFPQGQYSLVILRRDNILYSCKVLIQR